MLKIIGSKINMHQGDDCAFKFIVITSNGREATLSENDIVTIRLRRRDKSSVVLSKNAEFLNIDSKLNCIFKFNSIDTIDLPYGDYIYDVTLEPANGNRYTLINNARFSLLMSVEYSGDGVRVLNQSDSTSSIYLSPTPLVCRFNYVEVINPTSEDEDDLILF